MTSPPGRRYWLDQPVSHTDAWWDRDPVRRPAMSPTAQDSPSRVVTMGMVIVAGHLVVDPDERAAYLDGCRAVVEAARATEGCLDFAISADGVDPGRVNVYERWESQDSVEAFRGDGVPDDQAAAIRSASVAEYGAVEERVLS